MAPKTIALDTIAERTVREDAEVAYPDECCGFLYGKDDDTTRKILKAIPVMNSKEGDKKRRFEISAKDYLKAEQYALEYNLDLLGVYHSHPEHPAIPSEHDRVQALPFFSYIIVSVKSGKSTEINSYQLNESREFESERLSPSLNL